MLPSNRKRLSKDISSTGIKMNQRKLDSYSLKAIILDFDGVILESNQIKAEAFRQLFKAYPQHGDKIVELHLTHGGMPRHEKLRTIYREFLRKPLRNEELARLDARFRNLVEEQILECPFVQGAEEFLKAYHSRYALFVASGTPEEEMRDQIRLRGIHCYFRGVYGSPRHKGEILRDILSENSWQPLQVLFIGDAIDDYNGAKEASVPFIGRVAPGAKNPFDEKEVEAIVSDLEDLNRRWQTLASTLSSS